MPAAEKKIRVVVAKPGLDGHDRGAKIIARALRDAGMEVIYTGLHQTPEQIVETVIQEDADAVGLSILSGAHMTLVPRILDLLKDGLPHLNWSFLTSYPSRRAASAGILSPLVGTFCLMLVTFFTAVPLGIAAAVYLEEYAPKNWLTIIIEINISNLAGVPSIIYGLMALGIENHDLTSMGRAGRIGGWGRASGRSPRTSSSSSNSAR